MISAGAFFTGFNELDIEVFMQDTYAYSRIMAGDEESQNRLNIMRNMQIPEENIFVDYPTKEKRNKQQYNKKVKLLKENDLLYIT